MSEFKPYQDGLPSGDPKSKQELVRDEVVIDFNKKKKEIFQLLKENEIIVSYEAFKIFQKLNPISVERFRKSIQKLLEGKNRPTTESIDTIRIKVGDLGRIHTYDVDSIMEKAEEFGLEPCPAELAPQFRLQYTNQPKNQKTFLMMNPVIIDKQPYMFTFYHNDDGLWLSGSQSYGLWDLSTECVFRVRK